MKNRTSPGQPAGIAARDGSNPIELLQRLELEFRDEYVCEKRGYDPYDTSRGRKPDIWAAKRKRA